MINNFKKKILIYFTNFNSILTRVIFQTILGKFWLLFIFILPIFLSLFFFTEVLNINDNKKISYLSYLATGNLAFVCSFSVFRFSVRAFHINRNIFYKIHEHPLEIIDMISSVKYFLSIIYILGLLYLLNFNEELFLTKYFLIKIIFLLYICHLFSNSLELLFSFINIIARDIRFIGGYFIGIIFLLSNVIVYTADIKSEIIQKIYYYNPLSVFANYARNIFYSEDINNYLLIYIYFLIFFIINLMIRKYIKKTIYLFYSI